jgi:transposase
VLERYQQTRGEFYLFAAYEVGTGRTRWAFLPAKDAPQVCPFMRRVRQWYPQAAVWAVLDQDAAHPRQSHLTRQTRRESKLHWLSLPKGSPDDNPVETLFSDLQLMILDTSNDADRCTLQRRIGRYLRQRNRRGNRFIRVAYLDDSHKN